MEKTNLLHKILKLWFRQKSGGGLEAKLGYRFKDPELLAHALVHRSFLSAQREMTNRQGLCSSLALK